MGFRQVVVAGTDLVREAIRSPGFVTGSFGWTINRDGTAEFNNVSIRGDLTVGGTGNHIFIGIGPAGIPQIGFFTGSASESLGASLEAGQGSGGDLGLEMDSPSQSGGGQMSFILWGPSALNAVYPTKTGGIMQIFHNPLSGLPASVALDPDVGLFIRSTGTGITSPITLANGNYPIQMGSDTSLNMALNHQQIQARNNGAASTLFLQNSGGKVHMGDPASGQGLEFDASARTIQGYIGGVPSALLLQQAGGNIRAFPSGSGAFFEIQPGPILQAYNAGSTPSTLFLNYNGGNLRFSGNSSDFIELQTGRIIQAYSAGSAPTTLLLNNSGGTVFTGGNLLVSTGIMDNSVSPPTTGTAVNTTLVNVTGTVYRISRFTSSRRQKENITDLDVDTAAVLALRPRTFQRNDHRDYTQEDEPILPVTESTPWDVGFIAEEAEELGLEPWVQRNAQGEVEGFAYATFVAAQQVVLREHEQRIAALEARIAELTK